MHLQNALHLKDAKRLNTHVSFETISFLLIHIALNVNGLI